MSSSPPSSFVFQPGVPEQVADYLQDQIVRGELAPGERIAEARVTAALGVSRGPVREALQQLSMRHLVDLEPRRGARVSRFDLSDVRGLFDVYGALVARLVQRLADVLDDDVLRRLQAHRDTVEAAVRADDLLAVLRGCDAFVLEAARIVNNPYMARTLMRLAPAFGRAHYVSLSQPATRCARLGRLIDELFAVVVDGSAGDIAAIVDAYARDQLDAIEAALGT